MSKDIKITAKKYETKRANMISRARKNEKFKTLDSPVGKVLHLQRTIGNQSVQRLLKLDVFQAKLAIGKSNDKYEKEADRVADIVMRMPEPFCPVCREKEGIRRQPEEEEEELQAKANTEKITPIIQRQEEEEEEEVQAKPVAEQITPLIQRQEEPEEEEEQVQTKKITEEVTSVVQRQEEEEEEEEEEPIQTKSNGPSVGGVTPTVESGISSLKGGGQPLAKFVRDYFEPRFGYDFSGVRVYTGSEAASTARSINAKAFTQGRDIVFGAGQYSPETIEGKNLLGHELTHVIQQNKNSQKSTMSNLNVSPAKDTRIQRRVRFFVCNSADRTNVNNAISMSVFPGALRSAVDTASDNAAAWANNAATLLRVSPRSATTRSAFRDAFAENPEWVPPWFATLGARWVDFGDLIAQRFQRAANILSEGWIQYYCWGSPARCPMCTRAPSTYYACSDYSGRSLICLGRYFWELWAAGNTGDMAATLIHEALHIYFGRTIAHSGRSGNAACYDKFVYEVNGHPIHPESAAACPT